MSAMFSKFSKFRSKGGSRNVSPQRNHDKVHDDDLDDDQNVFYNPSYGKPPQSSPQAPKTPPGTAHLGRRPTPLPLGKHSEKAPPSVPVVAPILYDAANYDTDNDDNVSFAETLFPITPNHAVHLGRRSSESFMSDDDYSPNGTKTPPASQKKSPSLYDTRKHTESRRSTDRASVASKKSWGTQDGESLNEMQMSRRGSWEYKRDAGESRRTSWDAASKRNWVPDVDRGTTRSWTSSSLPEEEEIDSGPPVLPPYDDAEEDFLEEFEEYFNHISVDNVRREQYPKLDLQKLVYLDYASFSLYSNFQIEQHMKILLEEGPCLGSAAVSSSSDNPLFNYVSDTEDRLLRMLNTTSSHYSIIFTAGFQESFRMVAESYPFQRGSPLLVCQDNHAAVRPVIQSAIRAGGRPALAPVTEKELCFHSHDLHKLLRRQAGRNISNGGLFIYPAQSNLSGIKHSLSWVVEAQQNGWNVCIDATTLLPTSTLDLEIHQPDFVIGSFHHMVGYPSGMGFLLVRRESFCVQASPSGTLQFIRNQPADEGEHCHIMCPPDNSMNLLQFAALNLGLIQLERIGFTAIQKRTRSLTQWLLQRLRTLRHNDDDSRYLLRVYGSHAMKDRGSIVSFNVIDMSGTVLPPDIVKKLAARCNIKLSVGNFNNPGLANLLGGQPHEKSHDVGIVEKNWGFMAVRASLGAVSSFSDVYRLVQFLSRFRDEEYLASEAMGFVEERNQLER
ncbi:hypothetical protein KC19_7G111100 [Ceratodon purpureus]|uniref:Aminotransferase class V domain-containing protein n=1 Tax=Ceratodon purpureus TaxID=3225 RepID=A0A8T0H6X1_CERPU|nr:hypothetical protein KC19_7G111100 [Ceratodon purpureus]